ncbi:transposase, IS1380-Spn1 related, truncation [Streptococcus pneumoniae]|nr:transposase, IS1380-Spn1 related, truncation [Streptococcus pneumoniae]
MTNLSSVDSEELFQFYRERGNAENFIKKRKAGFFGDKTDSSTMIKNEVRMMMGCLAYNLYLFLKQLAGDEVKALTIKRFRRLFLHIAGKYVSTARRHILKFSSLYAYSKQFQALFDTICQINLILPVPYRAREQGKTA